MLDPTDTVVRPAVTQGPPVTVAVPSLPTAYDVNSVNATVYRTEVAALTLPSAYLVDPYGAVTMDGDLLEDVTLRTDPQQVVYRINPQATWSDGVPVSCQDFYLAWLANVSRAREAGDNSTTAFAIYPLPEYEQVEAPRCSDGGTTVTVDFSTPTSDWRTLFAGLLPAHVVADDAGIDDITHITKTDDTQRVHDLAAAYNKDFGALRPGTAVSAGPYVLASADESEIVLERNPRWWGNPAGPSEVRLVEVPDADAAIMAVRNGGVEAASVTDQNPQRDVDLTSADGIMRTDQTWPVSEHIEFNLTKKVFSSKPGKALREAMFHCIDRSAILEQVAQQVSPDAQLLGNMLVGPWNPDYTDHYRQFRSADVAKAKVLLEQAGWKLGKDDIYVHGKTKAQFTLGILPRMHRSEIATMVKAQCKRAGIAIKTAEIETTDLLTGKFQAALFAWSAPIDPSGYAYNYSSKGGGNSIGYSNAKVDDLFAAIEADLGPTDESERLNKIDELMAEDQVVLPLFDWTAINLQDEEIRTRLTNNYYWGGLVWDAYAWTVAG